MTEPVLDTLEADRSIRQILGAYGLPASTAARTLATDAVAGAAVEMDGRPVNGDSALDRGGSAGPDDSGTTVTLLGPAYVEVSGASAVATLYARVHSLERGGGIEAIRLAYERWEFHRVNGAWRVASRRSSSTGRADATQVLRQGLSGDVPAGVPGSAGLLDPPAQPEPPVPPADVDLEVRLRRLEDHRAVVNLLARYGIAADSGSAPEVGDIFTDDADIDIEGSIFFTGSAGMREMISGPQHQALLPWAAHTMGPALVSLEGDTAVSTHYARTYGRVSASPGAAAVVGPSGDRELWRFGFNRWELVRSGTAGWRVARRVSRSPAHPAAPALLAQALAAGPLAAGPPGAGPPGGGPPGGGPPGGGPPGAVPPGAGPPGAFPTHLVDDERSARVAALEDAVAVEALLAGFALASEFGAAEALRAMVTRDCRIVVDGVTAERGEDVPAVRGDADRDADRDASLLAALSRVGNIAEPGYLGLDGDRAYAEHVDAAYVTAESGRRTLARLGFSSWELLRCGDGQWRIQRIESRALGAGAAGGPPG